MKQDLQEIIDYIGTIEQLSADEKKALVGMIENGENPVEVLDRVEDVIQAAIDKNFQEAGVVLDEKDPAYQAQYKEMVAGIEVAEKEFNQEMSEIDSEARKLQDETSEEIDKVKMDAIRSMI